MKRRMLYFAAALALVLALTLPMALPVTAKPSAITITKATVPANAEYYVGDTIQYVMTVTNPANNTAINTVDRIWDTLPDGSVFEFLYDGSPWGNADNGKKLIQQPGETATFTYDYTIKASDVKWLPGPGFDGVVNSFETDGRDSVGDTLRAYVERNSRVLQRTVGGEGFAGNKAAILARWIALAGLLVGGVAMLRRRSAAEMS